MSCRIKKPVRTFAWIVAVMLLALAAQAATQSSSSSVGQGSGIGYDQTKEVTLSGTVDRLVSHPAPGSPAGLHLLISASGKTVDAHLGPFFSKQNQEALEAAHAVQVVGVTVNIRGHEVLLARQLIFAGRQVAVRNQRGFLVREHPTRHAVHDTKPAVNGGAQ